jgi:hypothetical protein
MTPPAAALSLAEIGPRYFDIVIPGERYRLRAPGTLLTLVADRVHWNHGELYGQLEVTLDLTGVNAVDGIVETSSMNFSSLKARGDRAALLGRLTGRTNSRGGIWCRSSRSIS